MSPAVALAAALALALVLVALIVTLALYCRVAAEAGRVASLQRENLALEKENERVGDLRAEVERLRTFEAKILAIMGIDTLDVRTDLPGGAARLDGRADSLGGSQGPVQFRWPARGVISRGYKTGPGTGAPHLGLDIAAALGAPVVAALRGRVTFAGVDSVFGKMVVLDHENGLITVYGHNSKLLVKAGDMVDGGQLIARVGSTGISSAPHLHFEVHRGDEAVDPLKYLQRKR